MSELCGTCHKPKIRVAVVSSAVGYPCPECGWMECQTLPIAAQPSEAAVLVGKMHDFANECLRRIAANPHTDGDELHTKDIYLDILKLCSLAVQSLTPNAGEMQLRDAIMTVQNYFADCSNLAIQTRADELIANLRKLAASTPAGPIYDKPFESVEREGKTCLVLKRGNETMGVDVTEPSTLLYALTGFVNPKYRDLCDTVRFELERAARAAKCSHGVPCNRFCEKCEAPSR